MIRTRIYTITRVRFHSTRSTKPSLKLGKFDDEFTEVIFDNTKSVTFNNVFLRDSCSDPRSVDPYSRQKLFSTAEISSGLRSSPEIKDNVLVIEWKSQNPGTNITSVYLREFLWNHQDLKNRLRGKFFNKERLHWKNEDLVKELDTFQVDYSDVINNSGGFSTTLFNLNKFGLSFFNNIPKPTESVMSEANSHIWPVSELANKFGYIKKTFYGTLFDVKNEKEEAKNIANTSTFLPLHMDLLYYESPPGLQLLHFINNSTTGGENVFADSFAAIDWIKSQDPLAYLALLKFPITYHYDNNNEYYYYTRPLVVEDPLTGDIKEVNYSPPFQGPYNLGSTAHDEYSPLFKDFLRGFTLFENFVNNPSNQFQIKMPEGSCVIFDNRRVLHSRLEFSDSNGGDRWLMGTYVDGDSYRSKLRMAKRNY